MSRKSKIYRRSMRYCAAARRKFGAKLARFDNTTLVSKAQLWRITKPDIAVAKVATVFKIAA
jgi:hypothetical protein